ncbi:MAG TPA: hypothetical protein VM778_14320 [Gemmatimonadota bacterium]|nr:hypothetical protein [Gemmatimonadota bacterium]
MIARPRSFPRPAALALAVTASLWLAASAAAGPPWISVEIPANPHDRATRDALLVVRAYNHGTGTAYRVTGVAEGIVDGRRVSVPLAVARTNAAGVYAVARPDLVAGRWVLVLRLSEGRTGATALVPLDSRGEVAGARVPARRSGDGWMIPRDVTDADVDAALRGERMAADGEGGAAELALAAFGLAALGLGLRRRR